MRATSSVSTTVVTPSFPGYTCGGEASRALLDADTETSTEQSTDADMMADIVRFLQNRLLTPGVDATCFKILIHPLGVRLETIFQF